MQEVGRAEIESSDGGFFCTFFVRGCSNRHIIGIYLKRCILLPHNGSVSISVAVIFLPYYVSFKVTMLVSL